MQIYFKSSEEVKKWSKGRNVTNLLENTKSYRQQNEKKTVSDNKQLC